MVLSNQHFSRINVAELKTLLVHKIGHPRFIRYLHLLQRFFSSEVTKSEFDKLCVLVIGKENLTLHNLLIKSILKNACLSKTPPGNPRKENKSSPHLRNGRQISCLQSLHGDDKFQSSARKCRSFKKPHLKPKIQPSPEEFLSLGSRPSVEDGEEVEQGRSPSFGSKSSVITAPLGISNPKSARSYHPETCHTSMELPDASSLRYLLERKLKGEGLSVSMDYSSVLSMGLDAYLKRLIEPCLSARRCRRTIGRSISTSMLDFRTAMELKPQLLGEDWSLQLEKICVHSWEEDDDKLDLCS